ncbi:MAG: zinc-finger domain-containing protein [Rickettsiaceae bacterium H1]|nr:zinc-finger domain-containing protein [Rickettsiaceae bacterium H1]
MDDEEKTNTRKISCHGGESGHPLIYLDITDDKVVCPYCGKIFIYDPSKKDK